VKRVESKIRIIRTIYFIYMPNKLKNKSDKPRMKVYIDGANVFYSQKKMGWILDWVKVKTYLKSIYDVIEFRCLGS